MAELKGTTNTRKTKKIYFNLKHMLHYITYDIIAVLDVDFVLFKLDL